MEIHENAGQAHDGTLANIVKRLIETFRPLEIHLFGSQARGEAGSQSDYDLLLVMPDDSPAELLDPRRACRALSGTGVAADVLIWPRSYFERYSTLRASLPGTIKREGRILYAG